MDSQITWKVSLVKNSTKFKTTFLPLVKVKFQFFKPENLNKPFAGQTGINTYVSILKISKLVMR